MLTGAIIGVVVVVVMSMLNRSKAQKGTGVPGQIEQALRGKEPMTLKQVADLVGKNTFFGRGEVVQALAALQNVGKVRVNQAPPGTPQLKKVDFITYQIVDGAPRV
jgi:hypothetical protein